ncbi:MAG: tRNA (adenosine(37)-N6)-threonylcarbamoyltransferase complex transferase subunit TsaD, partial [Bacteroidota bacterium]|nr:tRNA (adenosine(37)-N6)-threonylcarbamoyltransferase complex transferase subunit TsaD [Bacteroidota bacterium]
DLCASVQYSIISILMNKLEKAAKETGINHISISGGVSANSGLRETLMKLSEKHKWEIYIPKFEYCTDNAAMVAIAGYYKYLRKEFSGFDSQPFSR